MLKISGYRVLLCCNASEFRGWCFLHREAVPRRHNVVGRFRAVPPWPDSSWPAGHREPLDAREMLQVELDVVLECRRFPALEAHHLEQYVDLAVLFDKSSELRHKTIVIPISEFAAEAHF
jgi:hypothetical protein